LPLGYPALPLLLEPLANLENLAALDYP